MLSSVPNPSTSFLRQRPRELLLAALALGMATFVIIFVLSSGATLKVGQHFSLLAEAFIAGKLYFLQIPTVTFWNDIAYFNGYSYWALGPLPAVLLMPLVYVWGLFSSQFLIQYLQPFALAAIAYLIYQLGKLAGLGKRDTLYFTLAFIVGSAFIAVALLPTSYHFSSLLTVGLIALALVEHLGQRRYWLIGLVLAVAAATRITSLLVIVFFMVDIIWSTSDVRLRVRAIGKLVTPILLTLLMLSVYNYARFGNVFESGYSYQLLLTSVHRQAHTYGIISPVHVPGNLYHALLATPLPALRDGVSHVLQYPFLTADPWGMSIFVTSPYLLALFFMGNRKKQEWLMLATAATMLIPLLFYYGIGYTQFGYRYALDFYPLLFLLLARQAAARGGFSFGLRSVMVLAGLVNLYLLIGLLGCTQCWALTF